MRSVDWNSLAFNEGVLAEPVRDDGRVVLWLSGPSDGQFQYWERIAMAARAEPTSENGVGAAPAVAIRTRRRLSDGVFSKLARRLSRRDSETTWTLPDGSEVERCGERRTNLALAWAEQAAEAFDEEVVRKRWPECQRLQPLASGLFLVEGVREAAPARPSNGASGARTEPAEPVDLAGVAAKVVEAARAAGDAKAEALALSDLSMVVLIGGDAAQAVEHLRRALDLCREQGDRHLETDVLCNLGFALLGVSQAHEAKDVLGTALALAQELKDVHAEKLALERLGMAHSNLGDPSGALRYIDRALEMARTHNDRQQEPRLLWRQAIALADLKRPEQAIAKAKASAAFLRADGKPEAEWYEAQIEKYRTDPSVLSASKPDFMGGPIYAGAVTTVPAAPTDPKAGPGLLRMALSATKAMAAFLGSGLKTAPVDVQEARLAVCRACPHHTGLRCRICGCFTNVKSRMAHERCPIGKWPA
jgi:tetratricopeptide (TPR) repeat protein